MLRHPAGALKIKNLEGKARHHPFYAQSASAGAVQSGRVDEHWVLAAVVDPHSVWFAAQYDAETDFTANLLDNATAVPAAAVAGMNEESHCALAARVVAVAVVGVGVELAEAEARALR